MKTTFKEVAHLYLFSGVMLKGHDDKPDFKLNARRIERIKEAPVYAKPILRPLESLTEEEDAEFTEINKGHAIDMHWFPEGFLWLLKKRFDIFGLIRNGEALSSQGSDTQEGGGDEKVS